MRKLTVSYLPLIAVLGFTSNIAFADLERKVIKPSTLDVPTKVKIIEGISLLNSTHTELYGSYHSNIESVQADAAVCDGEEICQIESVDKVIGSIQSFVADAEKVHEGYLLINKNIIQPEIQVEKTALTSGIQQLKTDVDVLLVGKEKYEKLRASKDALSDKDKVTVVSLETDIAVGKAQFMADFNKLSMKKEYLKRLSHTAKVNEHQSNRVKIDAIKEAGKGKILSIKKDLLIDQFQMRNFAPAAVLGAIANSLPSIYMDADMDNSDYNSDYIYTEIPAGKLHSFEQDDSVFWSNLPSLLKKLEQ
jgi:hypothetical protein